MIHAVRITLVATLAAAAAPALAQALPETIAERACSNINAAGQAISRERLAQAFLLENGLLVDDLQFVSGDTSERLHKIYAEKARPDGSALLADAVSQLGTSMAGFEFLLQKGGLDEVLSVEGQLPTGDGWLFDKSISGWSLRCVEPTEGKTVLARLAAPAPARRFQLRQKPEELAIEGKKRKQVGAFTLGLEKSWEDNATGPDDETTTLKFDGTAGMLLTGMDAESKVFAYAQYNLDRARTNPPAQLQPGQRRNENDTNVLALGLSVDHFADLGKDGAGGSLWLVGQGAYTFNFVDDSERLHFAATLEPGLNADLGLCSLGSIKFAGDKAKSGARCLMRFDTEMGIWTRKGISTTASYDDFIALGANASFEYFIATGEASEVAASISYRYLPMIVGDLDDIDRLEASVKHRSFTKSGLGFDIGIEFILGTNALSLEDEKSLSLSLGLIL